MRGSQPAYRGHFSWQEQGHGQGRADTLHSKLSDEIHLTCTQRWDTDTHTQHTMAEPSARLPLQVPGVS